MRVTTTTPPMRTLRGARGFTLMEALIACTLLAVIGIAMATSLSSSINAKEIVEETSGRFHVVRQAMSRMVDEISMAYLSPHTRAPERRVETGFRGERTELHFTAYGNVARVEDAKQADTRELSYFLGRDERTGEEALIRRVQPNPDDDFEEGGREQTLLPGVVSLEFEYFDRNTEEWLDKWDFEAADTAGRLPERVRITFTTKMASEEEQTFTTQTKIWLTQPMALVN